MKIVIRLKTREGNFIGCSAPNYESREICFFTKDGKLIRPSDEGELLWAITNWGVPVERGEWTVDDSEYRQQEAADRKEWECFTASLSLNQREIVGVTERQIDLLIRYSENYYSYSFTKYGQKCNEFETENAISPLEHGEILNTIRCSYQDHNGGRAVFYEFTFKTMVDFDVSQKFKVKCDDIMVILKYDGSFVIIDIGDIGGYNYRDAIELPLVVAIRNNLKVLTFEYDTESDTPLDVVSKYPQFSGLCSHSI